MTDMQRVPLPGSARRLASGTELGGQVSPGTSIEVTLLLRRRGSVPEALLTGTDRVSGAELGQRYGADPADVDRVSQVLTGHGAQILQSDPASRRIRARGTELAQLFGAELREATTPDPISGAPVRHRHRTGALELPAELAGVVVAVLGLDDRPQTRAHFRPAAAAAVSYTPVQLG